MYNLYGEFVFQYDRYVTVCAYVVTLAIISVAFPSQWKVIHTLCLFINFQHATSLFHLDNKLTYQPFKS